MVVRFKFVQHIMALYGNLFIVTSGNFVIIILFGFINIFWVIFKRLFEISGDKDSMRHIILYCINTCMTGYLNDFIGGANREKKQKKSSQLGTFFIFFCPPRRLPR